MTPPITSRFNSANTHKVPESDRQTGIIDRECSDFTHWHLADGTDVEILHWLDDHSRFLLGCTAHTPVTGDIVTTSFLALADEYGYPASTLTDNGRVYTASFGGGRSAFEYLIAILGITQKNGSPGHQQTQGKSRDSTSH